MLRQIGNLLFICLLAISILGQVRADSAQEGVVISGECVEKEVLQLRLHNKSRWPIGVRTFSMYVNPWKYRSIKLASGVSVSAMPNDKEIESLFHWVERERSPTNGKRIFEIDAYTFHGGSISWISPADSIMFRINRARLNESGRLFIKFNYDWELRKGDALVFVQSDTEHRVYYQNAVDSANSLPLCSGAT